MRRWGFVIVGFAYATLGCTRESGIGHPAPSSVGPSASAAAVAPSPSGALYDYQVVASEGGRELQVNATFPAGCPAELGVDDDADAFVLDLEVAAGSTGQQEFAPVRKKGSRFVAQVCERGCRLRYRYDLDRAAREIDREGWAAERAGALLAPPSTWLVAPIEPPEGARYRFKVQAPKGTSFVTGVFPTSSSSAQYEAPLGLLSAAPYSAFGTMQTRTLRVGEREVHVALLPGDYSVPDAAILGWVDEAARDVAGYFGAFPIRRVQVIVIPRRRDGFGFSRVLGNGGATILAPVGQQTQQDAFDEDWQLTHEMVHLGFPNLDGPHSWFEEGMATYVEPIARARRGRLTEEEVWAGFYRNMQKGQPAEGDKGLDHTPTWGRRYWGGALFCLVADLTIRERTGNRRSFDHALRAIVAQGGNVADSWDIERALRVGDEATGVTVLSELYAEHKAAAVEIDLDALWKRLGVSRAPGRAKGVVFDSQAELATIRQSIVGPVSARSPQRVD